MKHSPEPPFHVKRVLQDSEAAGIPLDQTAAAKLVEYGALLVDRAVPLGLISEGDSSRVYERHVLDSLRAAAVIPEHSPHVLDLGSGAGLPGIVLAVTRSESSFSLLEPKARAAGFLELAAERLELENVRVIDRRGEEVDAQADVVTARAFGPVDRSWSTAVRLLRPGGTLVYFAGKRFSIDQARDLRDPEPPRQVKSVSVLENAAPLVMMFRTG